jgi:hypothetical protein
MATNKLTNGTRFLATLLLCSAGLSSACAAVRPEQRAILADPTMRHEDEGLEAEARQHVLENREGAFGGGSVQGGGCGCN